MRRLVPMGTAVVAQLVTHPPLRPELGAEVLADLIWAPAVNGGESGTR